jgi:hypothetical protein
VFIFLGRFFKARLGYYHWGISKCLKSIIIIFV